jgi:predicted N-acetyltransferase YhbS
MTEVRPIRREEADEFLRLLCQVFGLEYERAHTVFFTEPLFELERKWALFEDGRMVSILTTVPLEFGWGRAAGLAGVATREDARGQGYAGRLLRSVVAQSHGMGEETLLLFAQRPEFYQRNGFTIVDEVVRGTLQTSPFGYDPAILPFHEVRRHYDQWAQEAPGRLRRDDQRWHYWQWGMKTGMPYMGGYLCLEGGLVREAVPGGGDAWPVAPSTSWLGLRTTVGDCKVPVLEAVPELYLMGLNVPGLVTMFMTDQF